mgnify:FL=1
MDYYILDKKMGNFKKGTLIQISEDVAKKLKEGGFICSEKKEAKKEKKKKAAEKNEDKSITN